MNTKHLLDAKSIDRILSRMAHEITERKTFSPQNTALVGIRTRGIYIASRLQKKIQEIENHNIDIGSIDISFHRDDIYQRNNLPVVGVTDVPFIVDNKDIILVDDVLYTGRTIRAALSELMDLGRPDRIQLAVLIDRGHRELPIRADYVGKNIPTGETEKVKVCLSECDEKDEVILLCRE